MMEEKQQELKQHYDRDLKAVDYMVAVEYFWKNLPDLFRQLMIFLNDVFRSGRFRGSKLLEVGSGVTVHCIASASEYFNNIVMSDYVQDNVEELKKWLKGQSPVKQLLDVQAGLEGYGDDLSDGRRIIESRIRRSVKRVTRCDVLADGILLEKGTEPESSAPFDVVVSANCLECACVDFERFAAALKRLSAIIRSGGGLILVGFSKAGPWGAGNYTFPTLKIDESEFYDALTKAGFRKIEIKFMEPEEKNEKFEYKYYKRMFCVVAEKV